MCCPTFGVGLSPIRSQQTFTTLTGLLGADVMMSTTFMDQEFIWKNPVRWGFYIGGKGAREGRGGELRREGK